MWISQGGRPLFDKRRFRKAKGAKGKGDTGNFPGTLRSIDSVSAMICFPRFIRDLPMPRASRAAAGGFCYHVLNRGNARAEVSHKDGDYNAFIKSIAEASLRNPMRVLAYCLMPNHFHLALWPAKDGDLSPWMHWLLTTHVRRYQRHYHSSGHIWQGRFKAFPVQRLDRTSAPGTCGDFRRVRCGVCHPGQSFALAGAARSGRGPRLLG